MEKIQSYKIKARGLRLEDWRPALQEENELHWLKWLLECFSRWELKIVASTNCTIPHTIIPWHSLCRVVLERSSRCHNPLRTATNNMHTYVVKRTNLLLQTFLTTSSLKDRHWAELCAIYRSSSELLVLEYTHIAYVCTYMYVYVYVLIYMYKILMSTIAIMTTRILLFVFSLLLAVMQVTGMQLPQLCNYPCYAITPAMPLFAVSLWSYW